MNPTPEMEERARLAEARRVIVKVGTNVLVQKDGRPNLRRMRILVDQIAALIHDGKELVLVSSGAIGAGMAALGLRQRPRTLPDLQLAAAVGQTRLMSIYAELFAKRRVPVGQVLLTHGDLNDRVRHLNARNTMLNLMRNSILPIVNENDVVAVDEIKFGDNDHLASLVTMLVEAEALVLLSSVDGLRAPHPTVAGRTRRVAYLPKVDEESLALVWAQTEGLSIGGMGSKLAAARAAAEVGAAVVIADGRRPDVLGRVLRGESEGSLIAAQLGRRRGLRSKKRWIGFFHRPKGKVSIDDGAARAVVEAGKSLLPIGVRSVSGKFQRGSVVSVTTLRGERIAQGVVEYSSEEIERIRGRKTKEIAGILGVKNYDEVIHRDNMVVFEETLS